MSFDFKLRLNSPDASDAPNAPAGRGASDVELVDAETLIAGRADETRHYQPAGNLQSLILDLAHQIADPVPASTPVSRAPMPATSERSQAAAAIANVARSDVAASVADTSVQANPAATPTLAPIRPLTLSASGPSQTMSVESDVESRVDPASVSTVAAAVAAALRAADEGAPAEQSPAAHSFGETALTEAPSAPSSPLSTVSPQMSSDPADEFASNEVASRFKMGSGPVAMAAATAVASEASSAFASTVPSDADAALAAAAAAAVDAARRAASTAAPASHPTTVEHHLAVSMEPTTAAPAAAPRASLDAELARRPLTPMNGVPLPVAPVLQHVTAQHVTAQPAMAQHVTAQQAPAQQVPVHEVLVQHVPVEQVTAQQVTAQQVTAQQVTAQQVTAQQSLVPQLAASPTSGALADVAAAPVSVAPPPPATGRTLRITAPPVDTGPVVMSAPTAAPAVSSAPPNVLPGPQMVSNQASIAPAAAPVESTPAPPASLSLAPIVRKANAERAATAVDFHTLLSQAGIQPAAKRRKKRHPFRALFKLVLVVGIVGGGLYAGKVFVLDKQWDADLKPFAEAVSSERELPWKRAVVTQVLPEREYAVKLATGWLGITDADENGLLAEWRAMGIDESEGGLASIGAGAMAARPAFYDPIDGIVYELEGTPEQLRALALDRALTAALLDQHYAWSEGFAEADWDVRIARQALVDGDASSIARALVDDSQVVDQIAELTTEFGPDAVGAARMGVDLIGAGGGLQYLFDSTPVAERNRLLESGPVTDAGVFDGMRDLDVQPAFEPLQPGEGRGLMYWYYALASRLAPADAWAAAVAWDGDQVTTRQVDGRLCVDATLNLTGTAEDLPGILAQYQQWGALAPAESATVVTVTGPQQLTVSACDPGAAIDTGPNNVIDPFGESIQEHQIVGRTGATAESERACVVNAVRGFGIVAVIAAGTDTTQVVADLTTACVTGAGG